MVSDDWAELITCKQIRQTRRPVYQSAILAVPAWSSGEASVSKQPNRPSVGEPT